MIWGFVGAYLGIALAFFPLLIAADTWCGETSTFPQYLFAALLWPFILLAAIGLYLGNRAK